MGTNVYIHMTPPFYTLAKNEPPAHTHTHTPLSPPHSHPRTHLEVPAGLRVREVPTKRSPAKVDELGGERERSLHVRRRHLVAAADVDIAKHCVLFVAGCEAECGGWRRRRRRRMGEDVEGWKC